MANDYKKWLAKDVEPEAEAAKPSGLAAFKNWWHYHWLHVLIGAIIAAILLDMAANMLHIGEVEPDYQIAYVGANELPADTAEAIERAFEALGQDENGDGQTVAELHQYVTPDADTGTDAATLAFTASMQLTNDFDDCKSYFLLLEDPDTFQQEYAALAELDGSAPAEGDTDGLGKVYLWSECPALAGQDLGTYSETLLGENFSGENQSLLGGLYIGRRYFYPEGGTVANLAGCDALWSTIVEGAEK